MYESPINLVVQDIETQMVQKEEQMILEAIRKCGVVVDKGELIKAINYDRNQYSKGYKDGVNDVLDNIRTEIEAKIVKRPWLNFKDGERDRNDAFLEALEIIDKYKAESEKNEQS